MSTIDLLFNDEIVIPVIYDYFGIHNTKNIDIIHGVYEGLIKYMGVSKEIIYNAYKTNKLDKLIHEKYNNRPSDYYQEFCNKKIIIGNTYLIDDDIDSSNEDDDNTDQSNIQKNNRCPTCNSDGYKENVVGPPDCYKCGNWICKKCSIYSKKEYGYRCKKC